MVEFDPAADKIDLEGACKDDRVPGTLKCRRIAASLRAINSGMLNGLTTKSSAPACKSRTVSSLLDTTERMMMGTFEAALIRSSTSYPLPSGNDRSRMMRSGKLDVAVRKAVVAFSASSTLKSLSSKPARKKRLIFGSSSTTSTTLLLG